jgi:uncharacterized protein (DUF433 family)
MSIDDILEDYDDLEYEDILAVLNFATRLTQVKSILTGELLLKSKVLSILHQ